MEVNGLSGTDALSANYAAGRQSCVICLAHQDLTKLDTALLKRATYGAAAAELRVDQLSTHGGETPSAEYVASQIRYLRETTSLPTLFTIRTISQGGKFPDNAANDALKLMLVAVKEACEYIDVEVTWPKTVISSIVSQKENSKIIASYHNWSEDISWSGPLLKDSYETANQFGDIIKLSITSTNLSDNHELALFIRDHQKQSAKPLIAVGMGAHGQLSRALSPISMATHPLLPTATAPGQMSVAQINQVLHLIGRIPKKKMFIIGHNISHSLSPTIHNAGFAELGLPYHYSIHQTPQIDESVGKILKDPDFGGASVTYPHKLNIQPFLDSISENAVSMGAVNTVVVRQAADKPEQRILIGENTDWVGIRNCLQKSPVTLDSSSTPLVIGAGGAARAALYAFQQLGFPNVTVVNRSKGRAEGLASSFPTLKISILNSLQQVHAPVNYIVACIPADDITEDDIPSKLFASGKPGVLVEMAYRPAVTALVKVVQRLESWSISNGVDVLREQAYAQFELWTGYRAPVLAIEEALREHSQ